MRPQDLNLARRPFVNLRPVKRVALLLWLVGGVFLVANALLYWRHFSGRSEQSAQLEDVERRSEEERTLVGRLERQLAGLDLEWQNRRVVFLNSKIDQRTFSWSTLFDRLAEVLPLDLQLRRVAPRIRQARSTRRRRARGQPIQTEEVHLDIGGSARSGEALLEFVDALFAHPSFRDPNLASESRQSGEVTEFVLSVVYLPGRSSEEAPTGAEAAPEETTEARAGGGGGGPGGPAAEGAAAADPIVAGRIG